MDQLVNFILMFSLEHPNIATMFFVMGLARTILKPILAIAHAYVEYTPEKTDDEELNRIENNKLFRIFVFLLDYAFSLKLIK